MVPWLPCEPIHLITDPPLILSSINLTYPWHSFITVGLGAHLPEDAIYRFYANMLEGQYSGLSISLNNLRFQSLTTTSNYFRWFLLLFNSQIHAPFASQCFQTPSLTTLHRWHAWRRAPGNPLAVCSTCQLLLVDTRV